VDSIAPALLLGFGVPGGVATLGVLGWRVVNFWLPIPTGALAYVSLKVTPLSGKITMRSAFASLFSASKGEDDAPADGVAAEDSVAEGDSGQARTPSAVDDHAADRGR
jgi:hypothetical protein